jgi:phage terminase large subunit-like protein
VHKSSEELIRELYFWPNSEHDDALDSLALALYLYSQIPTK